MLLTKKSSSAPKNASGGFAQRVNAALGTMDRRAFLRRSGMVAGAGAFAVMHSARASRSPWSVVIT